MMRSLYSGISGLRNHQTRMDVIGNNLANVNTAGYKTARVIFQDIFSQNVASGMANQGNIGGTNPMQIGLGIRLSNVDVVHNPAAFGRTDRPTDMMINGEGFFILMQENPETGEQEFMYTRAGNFTIDSLGYLVNSQGYFVMGYTVPVEMGVVSLGEWGVVGTDADGNPIEGWIKNPVFGLVPKATPEVPEVNAQGALTRIRVVSPNYQALTWALLETPVADGGGGATPAQMATLTGLVNNVQATQTALTNAQTLLRADPGNPALVDAVNAAWDAYYQAQDDITAFLEGFQGAFPLQEMSMPGFSVANNGDVSVIIANKGVVIGRVGLAMFANPEGLEKAGNSLYRETASSGPVVVTEAYMEGAGQIDAGGLEMSNVDLADQFTDMIVTQRGFQANSRIITVSDTMLEELVNLKR